MQISFNNKISPKQVLPTMIRKLLPQAYSYILQEEFYLHLDTK